MNALPPSMFPDALPRDRRGGSADDASRRKWEALHEAAADVAGLAGLQADWPAEEGRNFSALVQDAAPWRRELAACGIEDIAAMMEPGLAALHAVEARGADPRPAALALWHEFTQARAAVLALLPPVAPALLRED